MSRFRYLLVALLVGLIAVSGLFLAAGGLPAQAAGAAGMRAAEATPTGDYPTTDTMTTTLPVAEPGPVISEGPVVTVETEFANIRSGPGLSYSILGSALQGDTLPVNGRARTGGWWQVEFRDKTAWVSASVVMPPSDADRLPVVSVDAPVAQPAVVSAATPKIEPSVTATGTSTKTLAAGEALTGPTGPVTASAASGVKPPVGPPSGHIAFTQKRYFATDVALVDAATGQVSVVATDARQPDVRYDGKVIFKGDGANRYDMWAISPDGTNIEHVGVHGEDSSPSWRPTGNGIVFHSPMAGDSDRIYVQWDTGSPQEPVHPKVDSPSGLRPMEGRFPIWLDGTRVAYQGCDSWAASSNCGIWVMNVAAPNLDGAVQMTANPQDRPTDAAGGTVLISSPASGSWDIFSVAETGGTPRNLTPGAGQDLGATFSPDGNYIAFMSDRGGSWGIWVMDADGSNAKLLAQPPQGFGPKWDQDRLAWGK